MGSGSEQSVTEAEVTRGCRPSGWPWIVPSITFAGQEWSGRNGPALTNPNALSPGGLPQPIWKTSSPIGWIFGSERYLKALKTVINYVASVFWRL